MRNQRRKAQHPKFRPSVESLEDRRMLAGAIIEENFAVPNLVGQLLNLSDVPDRLAVNYLDAETTGIAQEPVDKEFGEVIPLEPRDGHGPSFGDGDTDEHYQGIARSFGEGTPYLYLTGSGSKGGSTEHRANMIVAKLGSRDGDVDGEILSSNRLSEELDDSDPNSSPFNNPPPEDRIVNNIWFDDYGHAGGIQMVGEILGVSLERPLNGGPHGKVVFYDTSDPETPVLIEGIEVIPHPESNESGEVGVLGITRLPDGRFLMAASAKDGDDVLFYRSNTTSFSDVGFNFGRTLTADGYEYTEHLRTDPGRPYTFTAADLNEDETIWPTNYDFYNPVRFKVESIPASHQNFGLVTTVGGNVFLIGTRNTCGGTGICNIHTHPEENRIGLYKVTGWETQDIGLEFGGETTVKLEDGAHFAHAGGTYISPTGEVHILAGRGYNEVPGDFTSGKAGRIPIFQFRPINMSYAMEPEINGASLSPIRGIVAEQPDGSLLTKTSSSRYIEAGGGVFVATPSGENAVQLIGAQTVTLRGNVVSPWTEFFEDKDFKDRDVRQLVDSSNSMMPEYPFDPVHINEPSALRYWIPSGTRLDVLGESGSIRVYSPHVMFGGINGVIGLPDLGDFDFNDKTKGVLFTPQIAASPEQFRWTIDGPSGTVVSSTTDQTLTETFTEGGLHTVTLEYLPPHGLETATRLGDLLSADEIQELEDLGLPAYLTDPDRLIESDLASMSMSFLVTGPDLVATHLALDGADVRLHWNVNGMNLPADSSLKLFWSDDNLLDPADTLAMERAITGRAIGCYTDGFPIDLLTERPDSASHLLLVVDPDDQIVELDETNNLFALPVPNSSLDPDGNLEVFGTTGADQIIFTAANNGQVMVRLNNVFTGPYDVTGSIYVFAGSGNDYVTIAGHLSIPVQFYGQEGNDYLAGGQEDDGLIGGPGRDRLLGGEGDNALYGDGNRFDADGTLIELPTDGDDRAYGRGGNDQIWGGGGNDQLDGGSGDDVIDGGSGRDYITGGLGNDLVRGQDGDDTISGDSGNDVLLGGQGNDRVYGRAGNDILLGGAGGDRMDGGHDDDLLIAGASANDADSDLALLALLAQWAGVRTSGFTGVTADSSTDLLIGGSGADEFWANTVGNGTADWIYDIRTDDRANDES